MPDDRDPGQHAADARDERVAGYLAVEPLDDVTRRRLVSTALGSTGGRSTGSARRARQLVAAAAIVFVAVAGAGLVVALQEGPQEEPESLTAQAEPRESEDAMADTPLGGSVPDVGEFGELTQQGTVDRLRAALATVATSPVSPQDAAATDKAAEADGELSFSTRAGEVGCTPMLPNGVTIAGATGSYDGREVVVVQRESLKGTRVLLAVDIETCAVHRLS